MRQPVSERKIPQPPQTSFAKDISPLFQQFQGPMMWRFDLTSYEAVCSNASTIFGRISDPGNPMPPPPFPPLTQKQIDTFKLWMDEGCPP